MSLKINNHIIHSLSIEFIVHIAKMYVNKHTMVHVHAQMNMCRFQKATFELKSMSYIILSLN